MHRVMPQCGAAGSLLLTVVRGRQRRDPNWGGGRRADFKRDAVELLQEHDPKATDVRNRRRVCQGMGARQEALYLPSGCVRVPRSLMSLGTDTRAAMPYSPAVDGTARVPACVPASLPARMSGRNVHPLE